MRSSSPGGARIGIPGRLLPDPQTLVNPTLANLLAETDRETVQPDAVLRSVSMKEDAGDNFEAPRVQIGIRIAELDD
jgi:hypothetical protein